MTSSFSTNDMLKAMITRFVSQSSATQENNNPLSAATTAQIWAQAETMGNNEKDATLKAIQQNEAKQLARVEAQQAEADAQRESLVVAAAELSQKRAQTLNPHEQKLLDQQMSAVQAQVTFIDLSTPSVNPGGLNLTA